MYLSGREGHRKQFDIKCSFISAPQWHRTPYNGLSSIYKVTKIMPVKADSTICSFFNDNTRVWISCLAKNCILVLVLLRKCLVFATSVTINKPH